jgi:hypothetical protein
MSNKYGPRITTDGLVVCLDAENPASYPGTGTSWNNLVSSTNNAININASYNSGPPANFYYNGAYYTYINDQAFIEDTSFSVSAWIRTTDTSRAGGNVGSQGRTVASTYDYQGTGAPNYHSTGWNFGTVWTGTYFRVEVLDGLGGAAVAVSPESNWYATYLNQWTHMVAVFKSGDYVRLYQDGVLVDDQSTAITTLYTHNDRVFIGRRSAEGQSYWLGNIATFSYFNRWLSEDEVARDFKALKGRYGV